MDDKRHQLISQIYKLKDSVQEKLDEDFKSFHDALNEVVQIERDKENKVQFSLLGLRNAVSDEASDTYKFSASDILYWIDERAYLAEYEKWKQNEFNELEKYLKANKFKAIFNDLVLAVKKQRIVPFVGAGFSLPSKYPLWGKAIADILEKIENDLHQKHKDSGREVQSPEIKDHLLIIDEIKILLEKNDYITAADKLFFLNEAIVKLYIKTRFNSNDDDVIGPIKLLPSLTSGCMITTNYDALIEGVFKDKGIQFDGYMHGFQTENQFMSKLAKGEACLLKLHGHFDNPHTYVFTQKQYDEAYGKDGFDDSKPLTKTLTQIFISNSLLFLGCSLEEDRTLKLLIDLEAQSKFSMPEHFALLPDPKDEMKKGSKEAYLASANIQVIWYDATNNHRQLEELIRYIVFLSHGEFIDPVGVSH